MTTIAYRDGLICYDSLCIGGNDIVLDDEYDKKFIDGNNTFFFCGSISSFREFIRAWNNWSVDYKYELNAEALVYNSEEHKLYKTSIDYRAERPYIWKTELDFTKHYAIGSGMPFALTAMDCGLDSLRAVGMAIKRDPNTGGAIRMFHVPGVYKHVG